MPNSSHRYVHYTASSSYKMSDALYKLFLSDLSNWTKSHNLQNMRFSNTTTIISIIATYDYLQHQHTSNKFDNAFV